MLLVSLPGIPFVPSAPTLMRKANSTKHRFKWLLLVSGCWCLSWPFVRCEAGVLFWKMKIKEWKLCPTGFEENKLMQKVCKCQHVHVQCARPAHRLGSHEVEMVRQWVWRIDALDRQIPGFFVEPVDGDPWQNPRTCAALRQKHVWIKFIGPEWMFEIWIQKKNKCMFCESIGSFFHQFHTLVRSCRYRKALATKVVGNFSIHRGAADPSWAAPWKVRCAAVDWGVRVRHFLGQAGTFHGFYFSEFCDWLRPAKGQTFVKGQLCSFQMR